MSQQQNQLFEKLSYLGQQFDPHAPTADSQCLAIIDELELLHLISNPIELSNEILKRLLTAEEQKRRQSTH